ncbi:MAG: EAL domain-containing protein, partial [Candidatus Dormibacteraeota bacterium]|nr:EAL domain-containing protein [Candidatus Dormibacteraeota bacterium]
ADALLRNADLAMYRAKVDGLGGHLMFEPDMHTVVSDRVLLESRLRRAVQLEEFAVHYQPIIALDTGDVVGVEALVRWQRDTGLVPPSEFIPVAEETGLIEQIGRLVMRQAMSQTQTWHRTLGADRPLHLSINLSPRQLYQPEIVRDVADALEESRLDPAWLTFEITETALLHDTTLVGHRLRELTALGVRIALDDFGTGYSSLTYLRHFPISVLKVDKMFIDDIAAGSADASVGRAIIELARTLHLETVAEGVENARQAAELVRLRCTMGQGFHFSPPLPARDMSRLLRRRSSTPELTLLRSDDLAG